MYTVSKTLTNAYGSELEPKAVPTGGSKPVMPRVTGQDRRMTNVKLSSGECVQGIRRNQDEDGGRRRMTNNKENELEEGVRNFKPLRYTPGRAHNATV